MKLTYMATAEIACPVLKRLVDEPDMELCAVFSQPDRPSGRKRQLKASAVKERALELGIEVHTPEKIGSEETVEVFEQLQPDLNVVFAYGQYIPSKITDWPDFKSINIHPSLLPRYRGASPIQSAILNGDTESGISIIYVSKEMDAGDILIQQPVEILADDTSGSLHDRMAALSGDLIVQAIRRLASGDRSAVPQDPSRVVEVSKFTKEDGRIDWCVPAIALHNRVRAYNPWPSAFCATPGKEGSNLKVLRSRVESESGAPGTVLDVAGPGPLIACGKQSLRLLEVQPPGKKPMGGDAYLRGYPMQLGQQLD